MQNLEKDSSYADVVVAVVGYSLCSSTLVRDVIKMANNEVYSINNDLFTCCVL